VPAPELVARGRWRSAEDRLYPTLLADPTTYQRSIAAVQAVVEELRRRATDIDSLLAAEAAADELVATACPAGVPVPTDLLVAVACGMRHRELTAEIDGRRRQDAVRAAREAGEPWAVLDGPADVAELAEGRRVALHLASGTVLEAAVDPWVREDRFSLSVTPGEPAAFSDRDAWLAELDRVRADVEAGSNVETGSA
jgi:hypothetical protein